MRLFRLSLLARATLALAAGAALVLTPLTPASAAPAKAPGGATTAALGFTTVTAIDAETGQFVIVDCPLPYLATPFGPLGQCVRRINGSTGRVGLYSPITRGFNPTRPPESIFVTGCGSVTDSNLPGTIIGCVPLNTGFGPILFGTYYNNFGQGQWGNYSLITRRFSATSPVFNIVP